MQVQHLSSSNDSIDENNYKADKNASVNLL